MGPSFSGTANNTLLTLDPRTKFALLITVSLVMMSGNPEGIAFIMRSVCATVSFLLLLSVKKVRVAIIYALVLGFAIYCEGYIIPGLRGGANLAVMIVCGVITRFSPCYMVGYYTVQSTSVSQFITAMERMHVPYLITIPLSVMFRFFPTLAEEYASIHDAMKMREISLRKVGPFTYIEYILVPIMMSTVRISEELSAASLSKGLSTGGRTHVCEIRMRIGDWIFVGACLVGLVIFYVS
jgi:energy-coupling factor transport system permease protein